MISFSCSSCGMKLQVKDEFACRSSKCPTCKQPLVIPAPDKTLAVAAGEIDGTDSSLAKAGVYAGITLDQRGPGHAGRSVQELLARRTKKDGRYLVEQEIARGGMGVVLRAVDCDIRREVAVKYLLDQADAGKKARFVEEAQITGQLEHPNIVPIHELGVDARKRLFFSMKMVKGRSLADVLDGLKAEKEYSLGKLLNILVSVCNALAYAHSSGVVHRDLKPANVMIGDFGEVYVMDWGLAKVLKDGRKTAPMATVVPHASASAPLAVPLKVDTSRQADADLTQEGAVLGTPVYMPPEQATGKAELIDQRSDVYSLGAILYEMLTLRPPVDKEGGYLAILMRVMQGEIIRPEQQTKNRTIPKELSAIAMKALAKNPRDRYPTAEALRKDIERYQEGRSVSAKEDTLREALWKLVKRNRGTSAVGTVGLLAVAVITAISFVAVNNARLRAEDANARFRAEREAKRKLANDSVPAYLRAARLAINGGKFADASVQVDTALDYQPDHADARLLKGQLLVVRQDFGGAAKELDHYLRLRPGDERARKLADLARGVKADDAASLASLGEVLRQQGATPLDWYLFSYAERFVQSRQELARLCQKRIDAAWPGLDRRLEMDKDGNFHLNLSKCGERVQDLAPLKGIPLTTLGLRGCDRVRDLSPLQGMKLVWLNLGDCRQVRDLLPLQGMPLTRLDLDGCDGVKDLTPLASMKLVSLNLEGCSQVSDLTPLKAMPLRSLDFRGCSQVRDLTPLRGMNLTEVSLSPRYISRSMEILRGMRDLKTISVGSRAFPVVEFWKRFEAGEFKD